MFDRQDRLRPGERGLIACLACDRNQSRIILDYTKAFFSDIPMLANLVTRSTAIGFQLRNSVDIEITTNNFKSIRGRPFVVAILDECAFYASETSATPDLELYNSIVPGMATLPNSMLIGISTPVATSGLVA
jgi:phage terminase large subunit-like protein